MHIFVMGRDGSDVRQLTNSASADVAPQWTPDGRWVVFGTIDRASSRETIEAIRPDGSQRHTVVEGSFLPWVRISPDGRHALFTAIKGDVPVGIYSVELDGSHEQLVNTGLKSPWDGIYSPDGKHLVYSKWPPPADTPSARTTEIYMADADGGSRRLLATYPGLIQVPSWSPDGNSIAYEAHEGGTEEADIVVLELRSGTFHHAMHRDRPYLDETPSWTSDGKLLIQSTRTGRFEIYSMNASGTSVQLLTR